MEKWEATLAEYDAKVEQLDAAGRLRYDAWRENTMIQFTAMSDWTEAAWDECTAKVNQHWQDTISNTQNDDENT